MNNTINFKISPMEARRIALAKVQAASAEFTWQKLVGGSDSPMYELEFTAEYMDYTMFIDANDGSILGVNSEPKCA